MIATTTQEEAVSHRIDIIVGNKLTIPQPIQMIDTRGVVSQGGNPEKIDDTTHGWSSHMAR